MLGGETIGHKKQAARVIGGLEVRGVSARRSFYLVDDINSVGRRFSKLLDSKWCIVFVRTTRDINPVGGQVS
jgi:hypothetical protein